MRGGAGFEMCAVGRLGWHGRFVALVVGLVVCAVGLGACQVSTEVAVTARPNGSGVVAVVVTLDQAADAAIGGLAQQLQVGDLAAEGWTVSGPRPVAGGGESVTATHPFATLADGSSIVSSVAGSGASRPFLFTLMRHKTLWHTATTLRATVDLTCGLACFGDSGLTAQTGSPVGVDVTALARQAGVDPAQVMRFAVRATLPGSVTSTDAASRSAGGVLVWQPQLGRRLALDATTSSWNTNAVEVAGVAGGVLVVVLLVTLGLLWRRRRRRRAHSRRAHTRPGGIGGLGVRV